MSSVQDQQYLQRVTLDPANPPITDRLVEHSGDIIRDSDQACEGCQGSKNARVCQKFKAIKNGCWYCNTQKVGSKCSWRRNTPDASVFSPCPPGQLISRPTSGHGKTMWKNAGRMTIWGGPNMDPAVAAESSEDESDEDDGEGSQVSGSSVAKGKRKAKDTPDDGAKKKRKRSKSTSSVDTDYTGGAAGGTSELVGSRGPRTAKIGKGYQEFSPAQADKELREQNIEEEEEEEEEKDELSDSDGESKALALERFLAGSLLDKSKVPKGTPLEDPFDLEELFGTETVENVIPPTFERNDGTARKEPEAAASTSAAGLQPETTEHEDAGNTETPATILWDAFNETKGLETDGEGKVELSNVIRIVGRAIKRALE